MCSTYVEPYFSQQSAAKLIGIHLRGGDLAHVESGMIWADVPQGLQKKEDELRQRSEDHVFRAFHI